MHEFWKKAAAVGFLVFLGLWIGGTARGYSLPYPQPAAWQGLGLSGPDELILARLQNSNNLKQLGLATTPLPMVFDQADIEKIRVFVKHAQLAAGSAAFDEDERAIRSALAAQQAMIFNEKTSGIEPQRRLALEIGVAPERFDVLVEALRQIAHLESVTVEQRDRTADFRRLHAERETRKLYLTSLLKLRDAGKASIDDSLKLEHKIQEVEKEVQALGVQLGDLLGKESYYNLSITLTEFQPGSRFDNTYSFPRRLVNGFTWAVAWWFAAAAAGGVIVGAYLSVRTLWPAATYPRT
jgi:hypothetical protein